MKISRQAIWIMIIAAAFFLGACSSGGGGGSDGTGTTGTLSLNMVDKTTQEYAAVYVTIKEVQVCMETGDSGDDDAECEWKTVETLNKTYNLLDLVNGVMAGLGQKELEPGIYNQMRLLLLDTPDGSLNINGHEHPFPQYLIDKDREVHEMKVPSGYQSGIKLVRQFEIVENLTTELILDFDVARSVVRAGNSGRYNLKPTIKVIGTYSRAVVSGLVTADGETPVALQGALVSAWQVNEDDTLSVAADTYSDENGAYTLYLNLGGDFELDPKEYTLVATAEGHEPDCLSITVAADGTYPGTDFYLVPVPTVTVSGTITGTLDTDPLPELAPVVTISFRQPGLCLPDAVEAAFTTASDDGNEATADIFYDSSDGSFQYSYTIDLPAGVYDVVASGQWLDDKEFPGFDASATTVLDIDF